jgi:hypothetical protein
LGNDANIYRWNGTASGTGDATWSLYIAGSTPEGGYFFDIAYASASSFNGTIIGPSQLWAVDADGKVWYTALGNGGSGQ